MPERFRYSKSARILTDSYSGAYRSTETGGGVSEYISENRRKKGVSDVRHQKVISFSNGQAGQANGSSYYCDNIWYVHASDFYLPADFSLQVDSAFAEMLKDPEEQSSFELLTFIADLDDTIAMFSKKFLKELTYGSLTWGVLPFISDVKGLITSLRTLTSRNAAFCRRFSRKRILAYTSGPPDVTNAEVVFYPDIVGYASVNGVLVYTPPDFNDVLVKAERLLNKLGVHPDLKTLWDIIPFSFVVDYFLPIGDLLESLHPRGWGSSCYQFIGYRTLKLQVTTSSYHRDRSGHILGLLPSVARRYERIYVDMPLGMPAPKVEWAAPSLKQIFNTAYLTTALKHTDPFDGIRKLDFYRVKRKV